MDITSHTDRETNGIEAAEAALQSESVIPGVSFKMILGLAGALVAVLMVYGARIYGVPVGSVLNQSISTENALTLYTTFAGIGGFLANLIASSLISTVSGDTVEVGSIILPIAIQIVGAIIAAGAFPSGESGPSLPI